MLVLALARCVRTRQDLHDARVVIIVPIRVTTTLIVRSAMTAMIIGVALSVAHIC